ncbi:hypothetical protein ASF55_16890 [Methylobacterium sp. Leaf119]|nr:hypothetical protein ASF55_16890 [Methylobacterium sp. Leaf119]
MLTILSYCSGKFLNSISQFAESIFLLFLQSVDLVACGFCFRELLLSRCSGRLKLLLCLIDLS